MKVLYIITGLPSVFDSQVLGLLEYYINSNRIDQVSLLIGIRKVEEKKKLQNKTNNMNIKIFYYKSFPNFPFYNYLQRKSLYKVLSNIELKNTIIHVRGELIAWHLGKSDSNLLVKTLVDIRGASADEIKEYSNLSIIKKYLKYLNYLRAIKFLQHARMISVISSSLKSYILQKISIDPQKMYINHCLATLSFRFDITARNTIRTKLKITSNEILIVFASGGNANWQNEDALLYIANLDVKILNLSKKLFNHPNVINLFVEHNLMYKYLSAADIGFIWRESSITNKVASPVKYSEYLCCGLPVVSNANVDIIKQYNRENDFGIIVDNLSDITVEMMRNLIPKDRISIAEKGQKLFSIYNIANNYINIYNQLT